MHSIKITLARHGQGLQWIDIDPHSLTIAQAGPTHGGPFVGRKVAAVPRPGDYLTFPDTSYLRWAVATVVFPDSPK